MSGRFEVPVGYSPQLEARLLELPLANRYSGLVDRGETVGYSPQLEARLLELPLANRYSGLVDRGEQLATVHSWRPGS
jgi:hypothetical protein